jgi:hypothetical protein
MQSNPAETFVRQLEQRLLMLNSGLYENEVIRVYVYLYDGRRVILLRIEYQEPDVLVIFGLDPTKKEGEKEREMIIFVPYSQQIQVIVCYAKPPNSYPHREIGFGIRTE